MTARSGGLNLLAFLAAVLPALVVSLGPSADSEKLGVLSPLIRRQEHGAVVITSKGEQVLVTDEHELSGQAGVSEVHAKKDKDPGAPLVDNFDVGDHVTWTGNDALIPTGTVGLVVQVLKAADWVIVDFPNGRWPFRPRFLRRVEVQERTEAPTAAPAGPSRVAVRSASSTGGAESSNETDTSAANSTSDAAEAMPAPLLGHLSHRPSAPVDEKSQKESLKRCLLLLLGVFGVAVALGLIGWGYLKILGAKSNPSSDEAPAGGTEGADPAAGTGAQAGQAAEPLVAEVSVRLPNSVRYAYCLPTVATLPVVALIAVFVLSFYSRRGADLPTMAMAVALARSFDVVSDPLMSYFTDSCRHAAGRRRPFMIVGAPLYGLFLLALFSPPFLAPSALAVWFAVCYICFFLTNTLANIPYDAWGPELTEDSDERARLFFLSGLFDGGGTLFALGLPFAGYKVARDLGWTKSICIATADLVRKCAQGYHCNAFDSRGAGSEFIQNISFGHNHLLRYESELLKYDCDLAEPKILAQSELEETAIATFCQCMSTCQQACSGANRSYGFMLAGIVFAVWYILTSYVCCHVVKERQPPGGRRPPAAPLVPAMLRTLQNPAFACLLPAWACDAVSTAVFLTLCPYYVMYIIAPEFQTESDSPFGLDCKDGARGVSTSMSYDRRCNSMVVLGCCVAAALVCAVLTTPVWLAALRKFGKVNMWLFWSLSMAVTNFLFLFLGKSYLRLAAVVCAVNGIPIAAKFLADTILADIIDYDEFLTGDRNEATYTMFKSFLPKVMAIPAAALPLSIMNAAGHIPAEQGRLSLQPRSVQLSIIIMAGGVSASIAVLAWGLKRRYPLKTNDITAEVTAGIAKHKEGKPARDPVSGAEYAITRFSEEENFCGVWALEHFPGVEVLEKFRDDPGAAAQWLSRKANIQFFLAIAWVALGIGALAGTTRLLRNRKLSFIPTLAAVLTGCTLVLFGFTFCRRKAALELLASPPRQELVVKLLTQREALQNLAKTRMAGPPSASPQQEQQQPSDQPSEPPEQ